jgi:hypothetical protein
LISKGKDGVRTVIMDRKNALTELVHEIKEHRRLAEQKPLTSTRIWRAFATWSRSVGPVASSESGIRDWTISKKVELERALKGLTNWWDKEMDRQAGKPVDVPAEPDNTGSPEYVEKLESRVAGVVFDETVSVPVRKVSSRSI